MTNTGSYKNRETVIIALERAKQRSTEYFWDDMFNSYIDTC